MKFVLILTATWPHSCWSQTREHHAGRSCKTAIPCQGHRLWQCITCKQGCVQHLPTVTLLSSSRDRPWASVFWSYWHVVTWLCYCWTLLGMATLPWVIWIWPGMFQTWSYSLHCRTSLSVLHMLYSSSVNCIDSTLQFTAMVSSHFQIRYISQTQGIPAEHMLNNATKTTKFFYRDNESTYPFWRLKVS